MTSVLEEARALEDDIVADRRWLHEHPEIGFDLPQTTAYVAERLREIGLEPEEIVPGGLVATIGDPSRGRCFMLRADMDALPLREETELPFASQNGYMHACGHDTHTAMLLGAARILKAREADLPGCVKLMFQPDEEGCAPDEICGNEAMINAGVLENPRVDAATAIHLMPFDYRRGEIATRPGTGFSSIDDIDIVVHGKGGHGSRPHQLVDPFNIAARRTSSRASSTRTTRRSSRSAPSTAARRPTSSPTTCICWAPCAPSTKAPARISKSAWRRCAAASRRASAAASR